MNHHQHTRVRHGCGGVWPPNNGQPYASRPHSDDLFTASLLMACSWLDVASRRWKAANSVGRCPLSKAPNRRPDIEMPGSHALGQVGKATLCPTQPNGLGYFYLLGCFVLKGFGPTILID